MQDAKLSKERFLEAMRPKLEEAIEQVAQAVNQAPAGHWIDGSEWQVREVFGRLRQAAYEMALQMRLDAAEAAFSPSAGRARRPAPSPQGQAGHQYPDGERSGEPAADALAGQRGGHGDAGGCRGGAGPGDGEPGRA